MTYDYERPGRADYASAATDAEERAALRLVKSWHRHPALHDALWRGGVNLGELDEYVLVSPVLEALLHRSGKISP
jgi:hypothetical protein